MGTEAFFKRDGGLLLPTAIARSPWAGDRLHGRVITGLLASEIERLHGQEEFLPVRLTVDMCGTPTMTPQKVVTNVLREGRRIKLVSAELVSDGRVSARATCQFLLRTKNPEGHAWNGKTWAVVAPDALPQTEQGADSMFGVWELRWIAGGIGQAGRRQVWMREVRELVEGEPLTPFLRVASGVDYVSPLANVGVGRGYSFMNSDVSLYLSRLPEGEWIGYEVVGHESEAGIAIGHCNIYDETGRIGWGSACGIAQSVRT